LPSTSKELLRGRDALREILETIRVLAHALIVTGGREVSRRLPLDDRLDRALPAPGEDRSDPSQAGADALAAGGLASLHQRLGDALGLGLAHELGDPLPRNHVASHHLPHLLCPRR
jgi:hypothetical protein